MTRTPEQRVLVTGGTGCIGAVTVRDLLAAGVDEVVIASRSSDRSRLSMWLGERLDDRLRFEALDLGDEAAVAQLVADVQPTHVVHLAALQSPDCDRDPALGLRRHGRTVRPDAGRGCVAAS